MTAVVSTDAIGTPRKGLYFGGNRDAPDDVHYWMVYGVDWTTGKVVWKKEVHRGVPESSRHLKNTFASETPVADGERIYVLANERLIAFDGVTAARVAELESSIDDGAYGRFAMAPNGVWVHPDTNERMMVRQLGPSR